MKQLLQSIRILLRFKEYTYTNLIGLVFSVSCALIIARYIHQERQVDHFCPELERTFLTTIINDKGKITLRGSADRNDDPNYKNPLADPRVEKFSRFILFKDDYVVTDNRRFTVQTMVADSLYLEMMPHPVVEGTSALRNPNDAIITRKLARRLFKGESPMGKTLKVSTGDWATITGVIDEPATKASMTFELLLSYNLRTNWSRIDYELVQLHRAEDVAALNEKNRQPMELISYSKRPVYYQLTPLKGFYLNPAVHSFEPVVRGNRTSLNILTVVAALLLLIGIFNYTNLHTVVMLRRAREFGIKKVFGANGRAVFLQLYFENFCIGAVALLFVWTLVEVTRSIVATWFEIPVVSDAAFDLGVSACLLFGMPLLTSIFPFVRYNYAAPTRSLRSIGRGGNSVVSRMAFLFIQYAITVSLVVVAVYFCRQLYYVLHYDLNYQKENIILCPLFARDTSYDIASEEEWQKQREKEKADIELVRRRMDESPLFTKWTYGELPIRIPPPYMAGTASTGEKTTLALGYVDQPYMELFGMKVKEGRSWDNAKDQFTQYKCIINGTAKRELGIKDITKETLQMERRLFYSMGIDPESNPPYEIVGVVEDFKIGHLSNPDYPLMFCFSEGGHTDDLIASIAPGRQQEAIQYLETLFHEINGEGEFNYSFAEDEIAAMYHDDRHTTRIYVTFALVAIFISCLGLFGLSLYDIQQRYREIALRKVNGATARDVFRLLFRKYCYVFGTAFIVASGISYAGILKYMESYHHHAPLSLWMFLVAGCIVALISLGTLWWQIRKAIRINPAEVLKGE